MDRVRTYGLAGAGGVVVVAALVFDLGSRSGGDFHPPEVVPRGLAIGLLLLGPAIVALVGVGRRDAVLLAAAGLASLVPSWLSLATMPLAICALLLFVASASASRPEHAARWVIGLAIAGLQVGAIGALLGTTESRCWLIYNSPNGEIYRRATEAEAQQSFGLPGGPIGSRCDSGSLTELGLALAGVLAAGGLALAFGAPSRRRAATERSPG